MIIELVRFAYLDECTLGWLDVDDKRLATIERPWVPINHPGGKRRESCVPDGHYLIRPHTSARFPRTYALVNPQLGVWYQPGDMPEGQTWGRSAILIHKGNVVTNVIGCIAVGLQHGLFGDEHGVLDSKKALDELRAILKQEKHSLVIRPTKGTEEV